jgi:hypothetical protein
MHDDIQLEFFLALLLWGLALVVILQRAWGGRPVAGLALAYWGSLALNHLLGGLVQILPWYDSPDRTLTLRGFAITGYALAGLIVGHALYWPTRRPPAAPPFSTAQTVQLGWVSFAVGTAFYFILSGVLSFIRSMTAILSNGLNLDTGACCLLWWHYTRTGQPLQARWSFAALACLPVLTLLINGFLGFGIVSLLTGMAFLVVHHPRRGLILLFGPVLLVAGLSLYTIYLDARVEIRTAVWSGSALGDRAAVIASSFEKHWTFFNPLEERHLQLVEMRLNQNFLIGAAALRIEDREIEFAHGETLVNALVAMIPRILWRDKPTYAGSGGLVTQFTGIGFAPGTSVGIGHIMELYVNFGQPGVFVGFLLIGLLLAVLDVRAGTYLVTGQPQYFLLVFVPAQTLLMVIGNFAEISPAAIGSVVLCLVLKHFYPPPPVIPGPPPPPVEATRWNGQAFSG